MLAETLIFLFFFLVIIISITGYGLLAGYFLRLNFLNFNIGTFGLLGIFFCTLISYCTHLFFSHGIIHNSIINLFGVILFLFFLVKNYNDHKNDFFNFLMITIILLPGLFISKNHDDFPYYHLPYILNLVEHKLQFGIGNLNIAFRTPSSLFYLQSLFYLPYIKYYLVHCIGLIVLVFINSILIDYIFYKKNNSSSYFIKIFSSICFLFVNIQFWRLAEFGTDRAGQLISLIVFIFIFKILNSKNRNLIFQDIKLLTVLLLYLISIKSYFFSYILLFFIIIYILFKHNLIKKILFDSRLFLLSIIFLITFTIVNLSNTGCIIYPLQFTCYENFLWSVSRESIIELSQWYEIWSKAGAGPNFRIENPEIYIKDLNWIRGWIDRYFFKKVTDTIGLVFAICVIYFFLIKYRSKYKKNNITYLPIYFFVLTLFLIWFFKHPDLRYGGFVLVSILFFIPLSLYLSHYLIGSFKKKILALVIFLALFSYNGRNIYRIIQEVNRSDNFKYISFPYFHIEEVKYKEKILGKNNIKLYLSEDPWCWATPSPCSTDDTIMIKDLSGYNVFLINK
jgi:hypothetical protein